MSSFYVNSYVHDAIDNRWTLKQYLLNCCKGFGFAYHLIENGTLENLTPRDKDTSEYRRLVELEDEYKKFTTLTDVELEIACQEEWLKLSQDALESYKKRIDEWNYAVDLIKQLEKWPGVDGFPDLKDHALEWLSEISEPSIYKIEKEDWKDWSQRKRAYYQKEIDYYQTRVKELEDREKVHLPIINKVNEALDKLDKKIEKVYLYEDGKDWEEALDNRDKSTQV